MKENKVSKATLNRLPTYLQYLRDPKNAVGAHVSATIVANALGLGEVQVRKDLASVSGFGKPKVGYETPKLIACLEHYLGYDKTDHAVLVGAGKMGIALLCHEGFASFGLEIVAAFDRDGDKVDCDVGDKTVYPMEKMEEFCREREIRVGIITVPAPQAQEVCDKLVGAGVTAIWNFAPVTLNVPEDVCVSQENLALSLAYLNLKNK